MLLIYQNSDIWNAMPEAEQTTAMNEAGTIMQELGDSGEWIGGEALADSASSRSVRVRAGKAILTDGPFMESREQLDGYLIVECESPERVLQIATRWPEAWHVGMEIRPLMHNSGGEV